MDQMFLPVTINFIHGKNYQWTPAYWNTSVPMLDTSINISELRQFLVEEVLKRTKLDPQLHRLLPARRRYVSLAASVEIPGCRWGPLSLADVAGKFDLVSDLLEDPEGTLQRFTINVTLQLEKGDSTENKPLVRFPHEEPQHVYHRLGKVPIPEQHYGNDTSGPLITASGKDLRKSADIGYVWALLAYREGPQGLWQLKRVRTYDFDLFCIGDVDETSELNTVTFDYSFEYYTASYNRVNQDGESFRQLQRRIETRIEEGWEEPGPGVPFLPKYCFNNFQPSPDSIAAWPKHDIPVAVRCVNWLTHERPSKDIRFPLDLQFTIEGKDTIEDIRDIILQEINRKGTKSGVKVDSAALFKPPLAETWDLELWEYLEVKGGGFAERYAIWFLGPAEGQESHNKKSKQMSREVRLFDDINPKDLSEGPREPISPVLSVEDGSASSSKTFGSEKAEIDAERPGPQKGLEKEDGREEEHAPQVPETQEHLRPISKGQCKIRRCGWDWSLIVFLDEFENIQDLIDRLIAQFDLEVGGQDLAITYHDRGPANCFEMWQLSETPLELLRDANIDIHVVRSRTTITYCSEVVRSAETISSIVDE
ncbi:hypothetical protein KC351_g5389 [Hortaea werneckii]|nr:hypothetical protein KC351_g5389 [Hortaea werneckii]